ncbi:DUF3696 domain-containing protein [Micromonospora sp. NPDC023814]|uniref:DUF3696 domain-containing protein n=1 Tax=Micromonospora sp. NPDC023814 TaxID=3154596 RepID=UPI0033DA2C74
MINRLRLENFKAFRELKLPLGALTLLTGVNAAGKSTTIQALALLRQAHDAGVLDADGGFLLNGDLVELGVGRDVLHEDYSDGRGKRAVPIGIGLTIDDHDVAWRVGYDPSRDREADLLRFGDYPLPDPGDYEPLPGLFGLGFQFLKADRIVPAVHYPKSYEAAVRKGFLGARGEHTVNFLRTHRDDEVRASTVRHPDAKSDGLLDQTESWLQVVCPGVNLAAEDLRGTDLVQLSFGFGGTAGIHSSNFRYRPTNVGFGLTYSLPIIVACLSAGEGALVLLENPEAHLHPRGQTMMARLACLAASAGAQVIIESHSDHVLNGVRLAVKEGVLTPDRVALHYFDRNDGKIDITSPQVGHDGMLSEWPLGFFDEWDRALDRLLD